MLKTKLYLLMAFAAAVAIVLVACTSATAEPPQDSTPGPDTAPAPAQDTQPDDRAIITDRIGVQWDVTHARDVYDMNPEFFNYGLGVGAIRSVDNPTVLKEGDPGYPSSDSHIQVFGVNHNGEQRAYSISALTRHEVFNDVYPGESNQYLAVAY